jgi:hypothetical protein
MYWSLESLVTAAAARPTARRRTQVLRLEPLEGRLCPSKLFAASNETNWVYRYDVEPDGPPVFDYNITDPGLDRPFGLTFSPTNELFVTNRGPQSGGQGSVSRFLDPGGSPVRNGKITSNAFNLPTGDDFLGGELFVAQEFGNNVLRFLFDDYGNAIPNGSITQGLGNNAPRGVIDGPGNELFVSQCCGVDSVNRYIFDEYGYAVPNGVITGGGLDNPHGMAFSPWGELFVANNSAGNSVSRFVFDADGHAIFNGTITGPALDHPEGLAFSPWGELFVGNNVSTGGISRWVFDDFGTAIFNGSFASPGALNDLKFLPEPESSPGKLFVGRPRLDPLSVPLIGIHTQAVVQSTLGQTLPPAWQGPHEPSEGQPARSEATSPPVPLATAWALQDAAFEGLGDPLVDGLAADLAEKMYR